METTGNPKPASLTLSLKKTGRVGLGPLRLGSLEEGPKKIHAARKVLKVLRFGFRGLDKGQ